jgi:hypothetical protein
MIFIAPIKQQGLASFKIMLKKQPYYALFILPPDLKVTNYSKYFLEIDSSYCKKQCSLINPFIYK